MKSVTVYTMDYCPYCDRAKALLQSRNIPYKEIKVDLNDEATWKELEARSSMKTMPQIFIEDECVGGYTELAALDSSGELAKKL